MSIKIIFLVDYLRKIYHITMANQGKMKKKRTMMQKTSLLPSMLYVMVCKSRKRQQISYLLVADLLHKNFVHRWHGKYPRLYIQLRHDCSPLACFWQACEVTCLLLHFRWGTACGYWLNKLFRVLQLKLFAASMVVKLFIISNFIDMHWWNSKYLQGHQYCNSKLM